ncbi:2'-5' RNA ligase family protein [Hyphomonas sp.]|uniref:2'-5' RNA ligase family protein n=2 Tax=Hyphomonas sp. TaxID=87 RepID=UPI0035299616
MSRQLFTLAFPETSAGARAWMDRVRAEHDRDFANRVAPHFTLVFGDNSVPEAEYLQHVRTVAEAVAPFPFACTRAVTGTDHQDETGYAFLIPDTGDGDILELRNQLHTGPFSGLLRADIPYVPHITIGRFASVEAAGKVCDSLNTFGIDVSGRITALTIVAMDTQGTIQEIQAISLSRSKA